MKSSILVGLMVAALLPVAWSQFGLCSTENVEAYINELPNGKACNAASDIILLPRSSNNTDIQRESAMNTFCTPDCGRASAQFVGRACEDGDTARGIHGFCLPTGASSGLNRCRFTLPDYLDEELIFDLLACENLTTTCTAECQGALQRFRDAVGCCTGLFYSVPEVFLGYAFIGYAQFEMIGPLQILTNFALWGVCSVPYPSVCTGNPFPGTSSLAVGLCTVSQIEEFIVNELSDTCGEGYGVIFTTNPKPSQNELENAYDDICREDCQGVVEMYEVENCKDRYVADLESDLCLKTTARLGSRCHFTLGEDLRNASFFYNVGVRCFSTGPQTTFCPAGCQAALMELVNQLGCCYQSFYNNTDFLNYLSLAGFINFNELTFFGSLNQAAVWTACEVPLVAECTGDALAGADRFVPSSIIIILATSVFMFFN